MKKIIFFSAVLVVFFTMNANAKIWRCNNNTGVVADFTTIQAAHDAATAGDTIHIEPSLNSYGNLTMNKRLVIISTGNFIASNPGFQYDTKAGFVGSVTINNSGANGSVLMLRHSAGIYIGNNSAGINNISLIGCSINHQESAWCNGGGIDIDGADNIVVKNCYSTGMNIRNVAENNIITNNIVNDRLNVDGGSSAIIANNVLCATRGSGCVVLSINNSTVANNIFNKAVSDWSGFINCVVQNNFAANAILPAGNGNVNNVDMSTVFVNTNAGILDNGYQLKAASPAIAAGNSGEDLGAFGGGTPYKLAATPSVPSIYELTVPATPTGNTMNVTFSTKSN